MRKRLLVPFCLAIASLAIPATSQAFTTGLDDQSPSMYTSKYFKPLHIRTARYIAPYDIVEDSAQARSLFDWLTRAAQQHIEAHIAFTHSRIHPNRLPSPAEYKQEIDKFKVDFAPFHVHSFEAWNEANRGNVNQGGTVFHSPSPSQAASYWEVLRSDCPGCTIVGLDVLDSQNVSRTVSYIRAFQKAAKHQPSIYGLHNYSDTNRHHSTGTKAVLRATGRAKLWLTETGGVVKLGRSFPNRHGEGLRRAAAALRYMFSLARSDRRIQRLYIYEWSSASRNDRFDAGLVDTRGKPRPGYSVVRKYLAHHH